MTTVVTVALTLAACGRATDEQINQALGITPTATMSAEQVAESTAEASATAAARELALASPAAGGAAVAGDVAAGKRQFDYWCINCHSPGGSGPNVLEAGSPGSSVDPDALLAILRDGEGHSPPGPFKDTDISDKQVVDIAAYLHSAP
jgi:mono/diheme cytochrome c family protein